MPDSTTSNYLMIKPEITGSPDTWGNKLNADLDILDNNLDRVDTRAFATVPKDGSEDITALLKYDSGVPVPSDDYHVVNKKYVDDTIKNRLIALLPIGTVIMWSGALADIPLDWGLCNGAVQEGKLKPELRDKFVIGAGTTYALNATGGENDHTHGTVTANLGATGDTILTIAQIPSHNHPVSDPQHVHGMNETGHNHTDTAGGTSYAGPGATNPAVAGLSNLTGSRSTGASVASNNTSITVGYTGGSTAHKHTIAKSPNLPKYLALFYIVRLK